jgi:hypothetical protein
MTFGMYKGEMIEDVPRDYLRWVLQNCRNLDPLLRHSIVFVLENYDDLSDEPAWRSRQAPPPPVQWPAILTWVKDRFGTGDWLRGQTEHCLLCVRGRPMVTLSNQSTVLFGPVREHSRKPDEFYALVEALCPGPKVELFARTSREGWACHGNETERFPGT